MREPYDGKVNPRLVYERFKNCVFYCVSNGKGNQSVVEPCVLKFSYNLLMIKTFDKNWKLGDISRCFDWENMFLNYDEAKKLAKERNDRISSFRHRPYLSHQILKEHFDELKRAETLINKMLLGFENYGGIDFCDVNAGGIQVRIHHNSISGYTYGQQKTILYDFSNIDEIPFEVVREFVRIDVPEAIQREKKFIADGEKYGWD